MVGHRENSYRRIGVIGGMGPHATIEFYRAVVQAFQERRGAQLNFEFPEMLIHNVPAPDNVGDGVHRALCDCMLQSLDVLVGGGSELIAIPCNSAHAWIDELQQASPVPVLNIVEETAEVLRNQGHTRPLLLGTRSTIELGLYPRYAPDIDYVLPSDSDKDRLTKLILSLCAGCQDAALGRELAAIVAGYPSSDAVILGCTELPLIVGIDQIDRPLLDTLQILAKATYRESVRPPTQTE